MNFLSHRASTGAPALRPIDTQRSEVDAGAARLRRGRRSAAAFATACSAQCRLQTPLGELLLARTPRGLSGVWFDGQKDHPGELPATEAPGDPLLLDVARQLAAYFRGEAVRFDAALDLIGTPFQRAVWQALAAIERGTTASYGEVARRIGSPAAMRAVGAAIGLNPVSLIVPCHRVIGANGSLTGYAGGLDRKLALLRLEGVLPGG